MSPSTPANDSTMTGGERSLFRKRLRAGAFWAAVLLPFCILALLAGGLETTSDYMTLVALVVGNVLALLVGHDYGA